MAIGGVMRLGSRALRMTAIMAMKQANPWPDDYQQRGKLFFALGDLLLNLSDDLYEEYEATGCTSACRTLGPEAKQGDARYARPGDFLIHIYYDEDGNEKATVSYVLTRANGPIHEHDPKVIVEE